MRGLWLSLVVCCFSVATLAAQGSPFPVPQPQGGPIVTPDGRILSGMDKVKSPWSGGFEIGVNGSDGNSEVLKIRLGGDLKYDTPEDVFTLNGWYGFSTQNNIRAENKALFTARNELPVDEVLSWFVQGQYEYDEFRDVKRRVALHTGITYTAIKSEDTLLKFRAGAGASYEFGGPRNNKWIPEGQLGLDFEQKITDTIKFTASGDYYPDLEDWTRYRVRTRAAFEFLVDPSLNMIIRLGIQDRFDSHPGNAKRNDLDYFATLLFKF